MVSLEKFKLSLVSWDSDKDPGGYPKWVKQWSSVVRSTKWGSQLESFLDRKLKRKFSTKSIIPSFLTEDEYLQDASPLAISPFLVGRTGDLQFTYQVADPK